MEETQIFNQKSHQVAGLNELKKYDSIIIIIIIILIVVLAFSFIMKISRYFSYNGLTLECLTP